MGTLYFCTDGTQIRGNRSASIITLEGKEASRNTCDEEYSSTHTFDLGSDVNIRIELD